MNPTEIATFAAGLFALANPLIRLGPFLEMTESLTPGQRRQFLGIAMLVMIVGYLSAIWLGSEILSLLGVSTPTLNAAGGHIRGRPFDARIGDETPDAFVHLPLTSRIRGC